MENEIFFDTASFQFHESKDEEPFEDVNCVHVISRAYSPPIAIQKKCYKVPELKETQNVIAKREAIGHIKRISGKSWIAELLNQVSEIDRILLRRRVKKKQKTHCSVNCNNGQKERKPLVSIPDFFDYW